MAAPASAVRTTVSSGAGVTISDAVDSQSGFVTVVDDGPATPYPSTLANTNPGLVTDVDVYLNNVNHGRAADLDLLLVGPGGQQVTLMSDAGGDNAIVNAFVVLDDEAAAPLHAQPRSRVASSGRRTWAATRTPSRCRLRRRAGTPRCRCSTGSRLPGPGACTSSTTRPVRPGPSGSWGLTIRTKSDPYPATVTVSGLGAKVFDVDVRLNGLTDTYPDDLDVLLVGPGGQRTRLMSDVGTGNGVTGLDLTFDDEATEGFPDEDELTGGSFKPTDVDEDGYPDNFDPAPAPTATTSLVTFDGTDPNGTWSLYVMDDAGRDVLGTLAGWSLDIETDGTAPTGAVVVNGGGASTTSQHRHPRPLGDRPRITGLRRHRHALQQRRGHLVGVPAVRRRGDLDAVGR